MQLGQAVGAMAAVFTGYSQSQGIDLTPDTVSARKAFFVPDIKLIR